jgi:hypothetical protein
MPTPGEIVMRSWTLCENPSDIPEIASLQNFKSGKIVQVYVKVHVRCNCLASRQKLNREDRKDPKGVCSYRWMQKAYAVVPSRGRRALQNFGSSAESVGKNDVINGLMENAASVEIRKKSEFPPPLGKVPPKSGETFPHFRTGPTGLSLLQRSLKSR